MIAYATCVGSPEKYRTICLPGLQRVAHADDLLIEAEHERSIFCAYNEVLDAVRERDDLEALVLLHEDTEIVDPGFHQLVRSHLADDTVAVVGAVGARNPAGLAWWEGECFGRVHETRGVVEFGGGTHDVDTVDGLVMCLSPWAVRNLRFDDATYAGFDAYDADLCAQARAAGRRVVVTELPVVHRHDRVGGERATSDGGSFARNDAAFQAKWRPEAPAAIGVRADDDDDYFGQSRPEVRALVPETARRVLDVGCGGGALGAALKADQGCEVVGIEGFPDAAARARERLDAVLCLDLDTLPALPADSGLFDAMVFGDVLEHLRDPARLVSALLPSLTEDGVMVFSIPNVKHWSVFFPLLVQDRWTYEDAGQLDRTHVHFFTGATAAAMLSDVGLDVLHVDVTQHHSLPPQFRPLANLAELLGGDYDDARARLAAYQYLVVARRSSTPDANARDRAPALEAQPPAPFSAARVREAVPPAAEHVLDVAADIAEPLDGIEHVPGSYDAIVLHRVLERVLDPARLLRALMPALADDGVLVCSIPNVKHWSIVQPLLAHDSWDADPQQLRFFTLDEIGDLLEAAGLEGVEVVANHAPLPADVAPIVDIAAAFGAEREETRLRLSAFEYLVVARRAQG